MPSSLSPAEASHLTEVIEMFEVIVGSRPQDYESLDILKEAYSRLGRQADVVNASKRLAKAYVQLGQLSSAILEYESILQQSPADPEAQVALADIENKANKLAGADSETTEKTAASSPAKDAADADETQKSDDGRETMKKLFVDGRLISLTDFDLHWSTPDTKEPCKQVLEPFIQILGDKQIFPIDKSIKLLCEKTRLAYLPLEKYDVDIELTRSFSREICQRWCVLPFDRLGRSVLVATANPFNKRAAYDLEKLTADAGAKGRFIWYLAAPGELVKILRKAFR
jgi:tetratricopeptide (TPR) repeat protein